MKRFVRLAFVLTLMFICVSCGDVFRPVIIPNPPDFPDPRAAHTVLAVNDNNTVLSPPPASTDDGSVMVVNVSGDSNVSVRDVGRYPVHAVQRTATEVLVVNHSLSGQMADSLTKLTFSGTTIANATTITLPPDSAPNFVAVAPSDTTAYVALSNLASVAAVNTSSNSVIATIPVGANPVALVVTPDRNKLYVANQGSNSVSSFNTLDRSPRSSPLAVSAPQWLVARSDSQRVYALGGDGTIVTIDTTLNAGPDTIIDSSLRVPGASFMLYDSLRNRLYIPGDNLATGAPELVIANVAPSVPQVLARVPLPAPGIGVAVLPDGTRAYAASNGSPQTTTVGTISAVQTSTPRAGVVNYTIDPSSVTGQQPQLGMSLTVSGGGDDYDGTFIVIGVTEENGVVTAFQVRNNSVTVPATTSRTATGTNFLPEVTVIDTASNTFKKDIQMPAVPAAGPFPAAICTSTRFPFMMTAGGDSSRVYVASCDGGNVSIIRTSDDSFLLSLPAPASSRSPNPGNAQPPPQSPVFLIAGP